MHAYLSKRRTTALAGAVAIALTTATFAQELMNPAGRPDRPQGAEDAPVTLIEYSSPTCGHCVTYHTQVAPRIKSEFVDTGKVRLIYRPFVRNAVDAAIFMLSESGSDEHFDANVSAFYYRFEDITASADPKALLLEVAGTIGIDEAEFESILADADAFAPLQELSRQAIDVFGVTGTPTFFVNGKEIAGGVSFENLSGIINEAIAEQS